MFTDESYMELAIQMAEKTKGQTAPNPAVGAVVVNNGRIVGMGAHLQAGEAHAEVHALQMAGELAKGSTIYVTLEPCSHYGKTPPCANLIVETGVKRAVIATMDPNPKVAGRGIKRLQEAGIEVETGVLKERSDQLNMMFYHFISTKLPYVTLKTAMTLDGKIATKTGESQWITGDEARLDTHKYRHIHDAILVGVNTVIKDSPRLTTRLPSGGRNPIRIVLDTQLRTPLSAPIVQDPEAETWIITGGRVSDTTIEPYKAYSHVTVYRLSQEKVEIPALLEFLGEKGITSLFVEGGATVNDAFLRSGNIQQLIAYIAPKLLGGKLAPTSFEGEGFARLQDALPLKFIEVSSLGEDIKMIAEPDRGGE